MNDNRNILITGASGFIGSFLIDEAIKHNYTVNAIVRKSSNTENLQTKNIRIIIVDFADINDIKRKISEMPHFSYIIHNAGITKALKNNEFYNSNYGNTKRLIESLKEINRIPTKFIYISSLAAFGPAKKNKTLSENSIPKPLTIYGKSKLAAEKYIIKESGIPYIIFRPTAVYGPGDKDFLQTIKLQNAGIDIKIGNNTQTLTFIYVKDFASLIFKAIESIHINKSYFATDGNLYSKTDFNNSVSRQLNKKQIHININIPLIKLIAAVSEFRAQIIKRPSLLRLDKISEITADNWDCDIEPLISDFNFKADYNLENGMKQTILWYKKYKWLNTKDKEFLTI
jgi:nucleoside-diphosphate-sugar epimerase